MPVTASAAPSADSALARIRDAGVVRVASASDDPPDAYELNGTLTGTMPTLMRSIAEQWGVRVEFVTVPWTGLISAVQSGRADVAADALFITPERAQQVTFSERVYGWGDGIAVRSDERRIFASLEDLKGLRVGVIASSVQYNEVAAVGDVSTRSYDTYQTLTADLASGRIDAGLVDPPQIEYLRRQDPGFGVKIVDTFHGPAPSYVGFAVSKANSGLAGDISAALKKMRADGSLDEIVHRFDGVNGVIIPTTGEAVREPTAGSDDSKSFAQGLWSYVPKLLSGLKLTMLLAVASLVASTVLALWVAIMRMSRVTPVKYVARVYIDVIRGTPLLLQLFFIYYALPEIGILLNAFVAGVAALTLNYAAYLAEIFRGGIEGIPLGQTRAAEALGLTRWQTLLRVICPQAARIVFPGYTGMTLSLIKDTSLVAVVTVQELLYSGQLIVSQTFRPLAVYAVVGVIYLVVSYAVSFAAGHIESKMRPPGTDARSNGSRKSKVLKADLNSLVVSGGTVLKGGGS
jgi:His/Glu/Gln/Arg/opine family amino acid ABC transporter permease subunit